MSSARRVRRKYYALHEKRVDDLFEASPVSEEASDLRDAILADRDMHQAFDEQENEQAWARRRRSLAATAQILLITLTVLGLGVASSAVICTRRCPRC
jgi:hypothetical protein